MKSRKLILLLLQVSQMLRRTRYSRKPFSVHVPPITRRNSAKARIAFSALLLFQGTPSWAKSKNREKKIHIIGSPEFKIEGTPLYLDVEGLPDRDFYYLIGLRIGNGEAAVQYSLWADTVEEEGKIWREFLAILETVEKPVLIHYGSYETTFARSMRKRYGGAEAGIAATALDAMVNVLSFVFAQVYFPGHSNSLKDLASCLGFAWPDTALYGPNSIRSRMMWECSHETVIREALIAYNIADCRALQCLCNHLSVLSQDRSTHLQAATMDLVNVDEIRPLHPFPLINKDGAALPAFKTINKAAYWDYQRTRVYVRTSKVIKKASRQSVGGPARSVRHQRTGKSHRVF
jgi:RNase_H superfamily